MFYCRYEGPNGGPCVDYDECQDEPCADRCENTVGDYRCVCDTPGWIVDPMDKHLCKCKKLNVAKNLTQAAISNLKKEGKLIYESTGLTLLVSS